MKINISGIKNQPRSSKLPHSWSRSNKFLNSLCPTSLKVLTEKKFNFNVRRPVSLTKRSNAPKPKPKILFCWRYGIESGGSMDLRRSSSELVVIGSEITGESRKDLRVELYPKDDETKTRIRSTTRFEEASILHSNSSKKSGINLGF